MSINLIVSDLALTEIKNLIRDTDSEFVRLNYTKSCCGKQFVDISLDEEVQDDDISFIYNTVEFRCNPLLELAVDNIMLIFENGSFLLNTEYSDDVTVKSNCNKCSKSKTGGCGSCSTKKDDGSSGGSTTGGCGGSCSGGCSSKK